MSAAATGRLQPAPRLGAPDWLIALAAATVAAWIFMGAHDDFSYDYGNYIGYFERLADLGADDLWAQVQAFAPYPYILIPPAGFFEIGFALTAWGLMGLGLSATGAYALLAAASIGIRVLLLRSLGLGWLAIALLSVYAITLFDANAVRLGCALTFSAAALLALRKGRWLQASAWLIAGASFHLQSVAFSFPLMTAFFCHRLLARSQLMRGIAVALTVAAATLISLAPQIADFAKLSEYAGQEAASVGVNAISITALIAMTSATFAFLSQTSGGAKEAQAHARVWSSAFIAALPAVLILLLATGMGALGDRLWQFAFANTVAAWPLIDRLRVTGAGAASRRFATLAVWFCLVVSVVNITIRYPLSNFFEPLIPHTPITPLTLIT